MCELSPQTLVSDSVSLVKSLDAIALLDTTPCNSNPCQRGSCSDEAPASGSGDYVYKCTCPTRYTGVNCETGRETYTQPHQEPHHQN